MILVDTSVWIDWLRGNNTSETAALDRVLGSGTVFGICGVIYQAILQGADSRKSFERLAVYFRTQRFHAPADPIHAHTEATRLYMRCRHNGILIRSTVDCFIAQLAIEHELLLLHSDRDYRRIREACPTLRFFPEHIYAQNACG